MKRRVTTVALLVSSFVCTAQQPYFPKGTFSSLPDSDQFLQQWYSSQLVALKEPSLLASARLPSLESYRFLWLRTFDHPVAIRIELKGDGTGVITTKVCDGAGGYRPGTLIENTSRALSKAEVEALDAKISQTNFWNLASFPNGQSGTDGAEWIIEGARGGQYHAVDRWSPTTGSVHDLAFYFAFDLAQLFVPKNKIY